MLVRLFLSLCALISLLTARGSVFKFGSGSRNDNPAAKGIGTVGKTRGASTKEVGNETKLSRFRELKRDFLVAASGGAAGGMATGLLYPLDTLKTIRQSDQSLQTLGSAVGALRDRGMRNIYSGVVPTMMGSVPSSALYFGAYEGAKRWLFKNFGHTEKDEGRIVLNRPTIHMIAAASGNIVSSAVFVPKEAIKQKLQAINSGAIPFSLSYSSSTLNQKLAKKSVGITEVVRHIWTTSGWKGFFPSYRATLMRNIPSAMVRFTVYEELKHLGSVKSDDNLRILLVGGAASALSSACTTPIDVVKTRLATGTLPKGTKVSTAIAQIAKKEGVKGLYSGVQERALWSALFGGVGLTCFERCKTLAIKLTDEQRKSDGV